MPPNRSINAIVWTPTYACKVVIMHALVFRLKLEHHRIDEYITMLMKPGECPLHLLVTSVKAPWLSTSFVMSMISHFHSPNLTLESPCTSHNLQCHLALVLFSHHIAPVQCVCPFILAEYCTSFFINSSFLLLYCTSLPSSFRPNSIIPAVPKGYKLS